MATTVQQKDTTFTKIFVGGLPYHTTDQSLREFFEQFGDIEEAVVITDRQTGKSRGYGFVTMADRAAADRACKDPNPIIDGRKANVNLAYLGAKPRGISTASAFPFALKAGYPGFVQAGGQFGMPQYVYPSAYMQTPGVSIPNVSPHSPMSPTTAAGQLAAFEYANAAGGFSAQQFANSYEAAGYPFTTPGYGMPQTYASYAMPQPVGHFAAFQQQQIQERMQWNQQNLGILSHEHRLHTYSEEESSTLGLNESLGMETCMPPQYYGDMDSWERIYVKKCEWKPDRIQP